jgi:hypothetical protein
MQVCTEYAVAVFIMGIIKTGYEKLHRSAAFVAGFPGEVEIAR